MASSGSLRSRLHRQRPHARVAHGSGQLARSTAVDDRRSTSAHPVSEPGIRKDL